MIKQIKQAVDVVRLLAMQGGAYSIQDLAEEFLAMPDFARVQTIASPTTLTGSIQYIYSQTSSFPFYFAGGILSWDSGGWAGGETVDVNIQTKTDGTNWVNIWNMTQLAAAAGQLEVAIPHHAMTALLNIPVGFWNDGSGVRVGIIQNAEGGGYHVVSHRFIDGVRGG
tara:strand:- start:14943 stop:15446 length:504 start_codon:yes stop_codon:yes gene_type:complete